MNVVLRVALHSLCVLIIFLLLEWHRELSLLTIIICSVVIGFGLNTFMGLYRKFQLNFEKKDNR